MVNVLPTKKQTSLRIDYYLRLFSLLCVGAAVVVLLGGVLLVPSYFASKNQADAYERFRDALEGSVGLKERSQVVNAVETLNERVRLVNAYSDSAFSKIFFESLLSESVSGISIKTISFTRGGEGMRAAVGIGGSADTREDLLAFVDLLRNNPSFSDVTVPVSQLVVEENATFSIQTVYEKP